ncbi:glycosyltransferase [Bacillus horti]|uniref:Glycosyltransferase involved in cell wall biosynthesis n=1 Tax=Caldalkalibacillus horti TaxID=77523 RepID=A0ABT9VZF1_9BACI|nr:glycosyltransferase [Bacillus horti]MDQ0166378.1 glycosyltransferase involved in cell wall biosynthesis [Bacillus horti]
MEKENWRKKIVLLVPNLGGGGAEKVMLTLLKTIKKETADVTLLMVHKSGELVHQIPAEANTVDLGIKKLRHAPRKLIQELNRIRPDVILSTLTAMNFVLLVIKPFLAGKPKIVVRETNPPSPKYKDNLKMKLLYQLLYRRSDQIIAISEGVAEDLIQYARLANHKEKISVIYNPIHLSFIQQSMDQPIMHSWLNQKHTPVLLAIGRLVEQKDFHTLLRAFHQVRQQLDSKLIILGEGEQKEQLQALTKELGLTEYVLFDGFVDNPYPYLKRADLFVLSSKWEGFGLVLAEALATNTPIVSTKCRGAPAEILEEGRYGRLVEPGDDQAMAEAILDQLQEPLQENLEGRARQFDVGAITEKYVHTLVQEI